jgi:hypothetical protein
MHGIHRLGVLSFMPLGGVIAAFVVFNVMMVLLATTVPTVVFVVPLVVLALILAVGVFAYARLVVHIARRPDLTGSDRAMWIVVLFAAGPFGPPLYWLVAVRPGIAR